MQLLKLRVIQIEPSDKRDETILKRGVFYYVTIKIRTMYFFSFVYAEPQNKKVDLIGELAPTHLQIVFGVFQKRSDQNGGNLCELWAIRTFL